MHCLAHAAVHCSGVVPAGPAWIEPAGLAWTAPLHWQGALLKGNLLHLAAAVMELFDLGVPLALAEPSEFMRAQESTCLC